MKGPPALIRRLLLTVLALAPAAVGGGSVRASTQEPLTPSEGRGKQIYILGTSPTGNSIFAYISESSLEVPGNAMACANCHGLDGQGKPEGAVRPSNLTWEALTKPYGVTRPDGRRHPPYTDRALELAITRGTDPAGSQLQNVMPRYQMSRQDLADLISYLKRLGSDRDPGVSDHTIVIGTVAPSTGVLAGMGQAVKAVTTAFFDTLNGDGGIYSRRLELKFVETAATPAATRANVERLMRAEQVFAMTGAFIAGAEKEIVPLMALHGVPLIGPLTLYPQTGVPVNRQVFYLLSGVDRQSRALVDFAAERPELRNLAIAVVYPRSETNESVLQAITDQSQKGGLSVRPYRYAPGRFDAAAMAKQLRHARRDAVFFLGAENEALSFMREAGTLGWFPSMFLPSSSTGPDIFGAPAGFNGKVFVSFPNSPTDQSAEGVKEFRSLADKYQLPTQHVALQISAYSAAKVLVEALRRAGRDLSREKLIQALEGLYEYPTGLTPAITFGPNRRIGAMGTYVVTMDLKEKKFSPVSGWMSSN
jgi:ABC-type branched-subunit amino acid transport system substrate-binding protein